MSRSAARTRPDTSPRSHASARLGLTLRSVLLAPGIGFSTALKTTERRARAGTRPAEGLSALVLGAVGGAALMGLWLKVGSLVGLRQACPGPRVALYVTMSFVMGALVGLIAQALWGALGPRAFGAFHVDVPGRDLRLVWGASALPQVFALVLLLPLDLAIVGTDTFTTAALDDPVSTGWAAFSIALGISLAVWSFALFVKGLRVATGTSLKRALVGTGIAACCLGVFVGLLVVAALATGGEACPTPLG